MTPYKEIALSDPDFIEKIHEALSTGVILYLMQKLAGSRYVSLRFYRGSEGDLYYTKGQVKVRQARAISESDLLSLIYREAGVQDLGDGRLLHPSPGSRYLNRNGTPRHYIRVGQSEGNRYLVRAPGITSVPQPANLTAG